MGLFSFLNKNKQEAADDPDGGYVARDDDAAVGARARSKRASSAGEPAARRSRDGRAAVDPVLPEKKRARRRLVGSIALAMAVAIGLPMILDSDPKPLATDIDIRIPAKDKVPAQPVPVAAAESLDKSEEIVAPPNSMVTEAPREVAEVRPAAPARPDIMPEPKIENKPEPRVPARAEVKPVEKPPIKVAEVKPAEVKPAQLKPAEAKPARLDTERALAILEDKPLEKPKNQKYIVQVAALGSQDKADELQAKLKAAGVPSFTQRGSGPSGELIRVRVGPFSKEEGEKIRPKLAKLGLSGSVVPQ